MSETANGERVLIVEDEAPTRAGLTELVRSWGFQAENAADGEDALQKVTTFRPAIIVTDLVMPRLDGLGLLRALEDQLADLSVILLTAQGTVDSAVEAIKQGAYDYLTKPVDTQRLRILLDKAVERQETLREVRILRRQLREQGSYGRDRREQSGNPRRLPDCRAGGADQRVGADLGRVGYRKRAGRADDSRTESARAAPVRRHQLRRDSGDAARERDLRPREGGVHGRAGTPAGLLRAGEPRHALPRRDRRDAAGDPGEVAARAAGTRRSAGSAAGRSSRWTCA